MELYLDTANVAEVERLARIFPIAGVTTNPSIIAASRESIWDVLPRLQQAIGPEGTLFAQTMSRDAEGMVAEAKRLSNAIPGIVVKIPVTAQGLIAIKALKKEGITTLGTAVYSAAQGLLAALAGAKYVAPYVNRVDAQGGDGIRMVQELQSLLELHAPDSKVLADSADCLAVLGIGGGKTLDTAKALAHFMDVPVAIAPTIASTDAPCSALSVIYTDSGEFDRYLMLPHNPNMVIVDTKVVAGAPARLLAAGIGDALATWFEARACSRSGATTMAGGKCTQAALALAELCYNTLVEEGEKAMLAAEQHVVTPALERIIEANTYLSGVGFESGGLAAAHAIHNGMTAVPDAHHFYHGEKVAFGTLTQLVLENAPVEEIETVAALCHSVGLPITLAQLNIKEDIPAKMRLIAEASCAEGETIHNMPGGVTPDQVYAALLVADQYGQRFLQEWE